jgi:HAD superfamily hydrolase (TIGR01450 family)
MDGTIYVGERLLPGSGELLGLLRDRGLPFVLLTNNSSRRGDDYRGKLARLGVAVHRQEILTSGDATIAHLRERTSHRSLYLVGTPSLADEIRASGLMLDDDDPDCVVVGYDTTFTFAKLENACRLLAAGKPYYATHPDRTCITERGRIPDIAAILAACHAVTGRMPEILGKPTEVMARAALSRIGRRADETTIVGDQLDTDMAMARTAGLHGVLVLSGETSTADLRGLSEERRPDLVAEGVAEVLAWLR